MMKTNCWYKLAGQECLIKCKDDDSTISITCQNDIKWGPLPNIECPIRINKKSPTLCPTPEISETFEYTEDCASTSVEGKCSVKCRHGGMLIGNNYIKCTRYGKWSSLPDCTCSIPIFSNDLKAKKKIAILSNEEANVTLNVKKICNWLEKTSFPVRIIQNGVLNQNASKLFV
ncbi:sushi, von Willebrand factor type A, EGF and pentraxin domain-containing protein 1 [Caerostris extrusa]|uniref:Sushi, von Willebrand factor type A, EGF and pentraxin domain-containing protein 1 n=1 Tax=Caerostris extrusa TaxID=172846 RepID=A0AAV4Y5C5_CAEEX|nr:sushi, von Willebrand factor type A, EGF and pentraxin domain-containing protein 1 [Caerostris extrusa]